jgi:hypothetical protein
MNDKLLLIVVVTIVATSISIILTSVGSYPNMALSKPSVHTKSSITGLATVASLQIATTIIRW